MNSRLAAALRRDDAREDAGMHADDRKNIADVQIGDILTPDSPPRCCGRDMEFFPGDETSDSVWDCWELLCENPVYVDSNGVVTDRA